MVATERFVSRVSEKVLHEVTLRTSVYLMIWGGALGLMWNSIAAGLPLTQFAKSLNMTPLGFGILGGVPLYGRVVKLLGSYLLERHGHRKLIVIFFGLIHRAIWIVIALIPLMIPASSAQGWILLLVMASLSYGFGMMGDPAMSSWQAALIPTRILGRVFSRRIQVSLFVSIAATLLVSYALDRAQLGGLLVLRNCLIVLIILGALAGIAEFLFYLPLPDPPQKGNREMVSVRTIFIKPFTDREYLCFLGLYCTLMTSGILCGQFATLYLLDVLHWSNLQLTVLVVIAPSMMQGLIMPFWGRMVDKIGHKPIQGIGGLALAFQSVWLLVASPSHWIGPLVLFLLMNLFTPAFDIGNQPFLFKKIKNGSQVGIPGSSYVSAYGLVLGVCSLVGGVLSGTLANAVGTQWKATVLGLPWTYHSLLFLVAFVVRWAALVFLRGLENPIPCSFRRTCDVFMEQSIIEMRRMAAFPGRLKKGLLGTLAMVHRPFKSETRNKSDGKH